MRFCLTICVVSTMAVGAFVLGALNPNPSLAFSFPEHEAPAEPPPDLAKYPQIQKLWNELQASTATHPENETEIGDEILAAASQDLQSFLQTEHAPSITTQVKGKVTDFLSGLSPSSIGRWVLNTARTRGPSVAIALVAGEVLDLGLYGLAAAHPYLAPILVPYASSPTNEIIAYTTTSGLPNLRHDFAIWNRHGGIFHGIYGYYGFLLEQRKIAPLDWSRIVSVVGSHEDPNRKVGVENAPLAQRLLPHAVKVIAYPEDEAMRSSAPVIDVSDLRSIAKSANVNVGALKRFTDNPDFYVRTLLLTIEQNPASSEKLEQLISDRNAQFPDFWAKLKAGVDINPVLGVDEPSSDTLLKMASDARAGGETPSVLAERLLWDLQDTQRRALAETSELKLVPKSVSVPLRASEKELRRDGPLNRLATTRSLDDSNAAYLHVFRTAREAAGSLKSAIAEIVSARDNPKPRPTLSDSLNCVMTRLKSLLW